MLLKCVCVLFTSAGHIFFPTLGIVTLLLRVPWGSLLDLGTTCLGMCEGNNVRLGAFLNSQRSSALNLFCYPVWREEEPVLPFKQPRLRSVPLPEWGRRGWDRLMPGSSKGWLPLFSPHLCVWLPDQP